MLSREDFLSKYTRHLNEKQLRAVECVDGPILLLAVPGSGKTTVLVNRLGYMLYVAGIEPENILTLTYTVAATNDMARRFESIFGEDYAGRLEFRTINGICARIIYQYGKMIGKEPFRLLSDENGTGRILTDILAKYLSEYPTESDVKGAVSLIAYCKNMLLTDEEIVEMGEQEGIPLFDIYKDYNDYLKANSLMDYDDQMVYAYRMLKRNPELLKFYQKIYKYICVDEAQDTSKIQQMIINLLAGENGNLFMVGDEDQSIYGFRAAYPEALLDFEKNHPGAKVLVMDQNYRSSAKIVSAADLVICHNKARHDKLMVAVRNAGSDINYIELKTRANQYGYLLKVAANCTVETAVLYRDNESALPLIDRLERQGLQYRIKSVDMGFFTHRVVTDVTNILRFAMDPKDTDLFMKIYFKCQTYLRKSQAEEMCRISGEKGIPVLDAAGYMSDLNRMVLGKLRGLATNLRSMRKESPSKALFRIENPCGYGEYMERNGLDSNKMYILNQLAYNETSITGFLTRLEYLQNKLKNSSPDYSCAFILSTIHSSKGLEYDRVYLMDVYDGLFPNQLEGATESASDQEKKLFEEERRLFYVGMTRAKNDLNIFKLADFPSRFILESRPPAVVKRGQAGSCGTKTGLRLDKRQAGVNSIGKAVFKGKPVSDYELIIGERVVSEKYGHGVITDTEYDMKSGSGRTGKFSVQFDSGEEKIFVFPIAFVSGMRLESGDEIKIEYE